MTEENVKMIKMVTKNDRGFHFDEHVVIPNTSGCFHYDNMWYFYSTDEKAYESICGPFSEKGIIYALALEYDTTDLVGSLTFSDDEWDVYYNSHFYSIEEVTKKDSMAGTYYSGFEPMSKAWIHISANILNGEKIPHSISRPVLCMSSDVLYMAVFVFFYNKDDIENGAVDRPTLWALVDVSSGDIIERFQTKDKEFSDAPYDMKYNVRSDRKYDTSKEYYDRAYDLLDKIRIHYLESGEILIDDYERYIQLILANIPDEYKRFYTDLSQI